MASPREASGMNAGWPSPPKLARLKINTATSAHSNARQSLRGSHRENPTAEEARAPRPSWTFATRLALRTGRRLMRVVFGVICTSVSWTVLYRVSLVLSSPLRALQCDPVHLTVVGILSGEGAGPATDRNSRCRPRALPAPQSAAACLPCRARHRQARQADRKSVV